MIYKKLTAVAATAAVAVAGGGTAAIAAKKPPKTATIKAVQTVRVKINRFVRDGLRWNRDAYTVKSGGTIKLVQLAAAEGPHTFSVVKKKDLPRTKKQILGNCKVCNQLGQAHGAPENGEGPPKYQFLENGKGQDTPPNVDRPGDSAVFGNKRGETLKLKVTAKKGRTLYFMCIIHPWMQAKVRVR